MKKHITFPILLSVLVIAACNPIRVSTDHEDGVDFAAYQSYSYSERAGDTPLDPEADKILINSIDNAMRAKGFTKADKGDVRVDIFINTEQKVEDNSYIQGYGGFAKNIERVKVYTVGSIFIMLVDQAENKMVWQGIAEGTVAEENEDIENQIREAVAKIFDKYPPN